MCGIAGYSLSPRSSADRTLAAQALLAGIADRGADAVGYAYRGKQDAYPVITKQRTAASHLLDRITVPAHANEQNDPRALEELAGSMATAWLDQREPGTVFAARGVGRPLWLGRGRDEVFFASTRAALEIASEYTGVRLRLTELRDGTFLALRDGRVARTARFRPDRNYVEERSLPAVRAPGQSAYCLARLAVIAAAA